MTHLLDAETASRMLAAKGYTTERLPTGFTVTDAEGKIVARTLVDVQGRVARHALKHLLDQDNRSPEQVRLDLYAKHGKTAP